VTPIGLRVLRLLVNRSGEVGELARVVLEAEGEREGELAAPSAPRLQSVSTGRVQAFRERMKRVSETHETGHETLGETGHETAVSSLSSSPSALSSSQNHSESERVSSSLGTREAFHETHETASETEPETRRMKRVSGNGERYIAPTDEPDAELLAVAQMVGVQDVEAAWLKFTGHYAGKWVHVAGAWQKWCATEGKHERTERERERQRGKDSAAPLTEDGLDPNSSEACERRKRRKKAEDDAFFEKRLAIAKASGEVKAR
jgi:hypothetical protein